MNATGQEKFKRVLRNVESSFKLEDSGRTTGRNREATVQQRRWNVQLLHNLILNDDSVAEMLDDNEKLAARYAEVERRVYGLGSGR